MWAMQSGEDMAALAPYRGLRTETANLYESIRDRTRRAINGALRREAIPNIKKMRGQGGSQSQSHPVPWRTNKSGPHGKDNEDCCAEHTRDPAPVQAAPAQPNGFKREHEQNDVGRVATVE